MRKIFIVVLIMMTSAFPVLGDDNQSTNSTTYRVFVDNSHGFYIVYEENSGMLVEYENRTLNISNGDTIIWINDALLDTRLTIANEQNLWEMYEGELGWNYRRFNHTFNKSGIYDIYIKEFPIFKQKIIVGPIETVVNETINGTKSYSACGEQKTNATNDTKPDFACDEKKTNVLINNSTVPVTDPLEKKPGTEIVVLVTVTSLLVYIFERKIK